MGRVRGRWLGPIAVVAALLAIGLSGCGGSSGSGAHRHGGGPSATAHAVSYGIGDAPGTFAQCAPGHPRCCDTARGRCDTAQLTGYFNNPLFLKLTTPASAHRVRTVRLFVPYDAVAEWNGSDSSPGCTPSRQLRQAWKAPAGYAVAAGEAIDQLQAEVIEAHADGLTPLITISGYPQRFDRPPWDVPMVDPTTTGGYWGLRCGVQGILSTLDRLPRVERPHVWEPLNEPETFPIFVGSGPARAGACAVGAHPQPDGPAKAACAQALAQRIIQATPGHASDTVIAGDFQHPYDDYLATFVAQLSRQLHGRAFPSTWSVHAYHEITEAYTGARPTNIARFDQALHRDTRGRARSLWITEAATVLTSTFPATGCRAAGVDRAGTLGACINGQPTRQATSARVFFSLAHVADAVPITHLFWYQFTGAAGWDSGLLDARDAPRPVYCRFFGGGHCPGSPDAA